MTLCDLVRIAEGATAEIFAWTPGHVLKLYRDGYPPDEAEQEASRVRAAAASGIPMPAAVDLVTVEGRQGVVYERVEGLTMLQTLMTSPERRTALAEEMAELHAAMHHKFVPGLPSQRERLKRHILHAHNLPGATRTAVLACLNRLPDDHLLCHGDFHPDNILMTEHGAVIIDWVDATQGYPMADVARTWLLLVTTSLPPRMPEVQRQQIEGLRQQFCEAYLQRYHQLQPGAQAEMDAWLPIVAAARLIERISDTGERNRLLKIASAAESAEQTPYASRTNEHQNCPKP